MLTERKRINSAASIASGTPKVRADVMDQGNIDIEAGKNVEEGKDSENNVRSDTGGRKEAGGWHGVPPLRCVIAWQEIRASAFQLRNELLRELQLNFCIRASKYSQETAQTEWRTVLHDPGVRCVPQFFCFAESVVQLTEAVD